MTDRLAAAMPPLRKIPRSAFVAVLVATAILFAADGCSKSNPAKPTPICAFALSSHDLSVVSGGGPAAVTVETEAGCSWSVQGATGWVTLQSPVSMTGTGTVHFTVLPNTTIDTRTKPLTIAGAIFMVTQAGQTPCAYSIAPESKAFGDEGGTGDVQVTTTSGCDWTAASNVGWISITGTAKGSGSGSLSYSVAANNASTSRLATLTIAGHAFTVTQAGEGTQPSNCEYSVSPVTFTPCMPGSRVTALLTTQASCSWTVNTSAPWLALPGGKSGKGSATIAIDFSDNYDAPRDGTVMVRWPTITAGQNIQIEQAGCLYSVSQATFSFTSASATGTFMVFQESEPNTCGGALQDRCVWSARSNVAWITVTSSMPTQGDNPVAFTVGANTGTTSRTGLITVRDKVVTVTQAAP